MTSKEFVEKVTPGLIEYLEKNQLASEDEYDRLNHPEDLVANTVSYFEVMFHVVSDLGVAPIKTEESPRVRSDRR